MTKAVYTVCTSAFLCQADVMLSSFLMHNRDYRAVVFLVNTDPAYTYSSSAFSIVTVSGSIIPGFEQMAAQYTYFELCCALKPAGALHLMKEGAFDTIVYLDTDIYIVNAFSAAEEMLHSASILITPHSFSPLPDDNHLPEESGTNNSGIYNAGFFALKNDENSARFLQWWHHKMLTHCFVDFCKGLFVDQVWLNNVPLYFKGVKIVTDPGYNAAYWNLHERSITFSQNEYLVNGSHKLVFVHLSGYDTAQPAALSKYQTRYKLADFPALQEIFNQYKTSLEECRGKAPAKLENRQSKKLSVLRLVNRLIAITGFKIVKK